MTKACAIPREVKKKVFERDHGCCVLCGSTKGHPDAHYIPRSHGGLGIEENIVTLCPDCHREYDNGPDRQVIKAELRGYLLTKYDDWFEDKLVYKKYGSCNYAERAVNADGHNGNTENMKR